MTMSTYHLTFLLLMCKAIYYTECLECFSCTNVTACHYLITCSSNEHCFTRVDGHGSNALFTFGCRNNQQCVSPATTEQPLSIIGRDISGRDISGRDISVNSNIECDQCCAQNYCNKHMCSYAAHVDGGWSVWASWSACYVTCASGHNSRHRTCTNPTPASGGIDCVGTPTETTTCVMKPCPVHGGWSQWLSWGTCSQQCGVGLERRDRSCSKPYPGPNGDPCFGDASDDRTCFAQACANGNWSAWSEWGNCSASCDGGLMERTRKCDNPVPSSFGKYCVGRSVDTSLCNTHGCKAIAVYFTVHTPNRNLVSGRPVFTNVVENVGNGYNVSSAQFIDRQTDRQTDSLL